MSLRAPNFLGHTTRVTGSSCCPSFCVIALNVQLQLPLWYRLSPLYSFREPYPYPACYIHHRSRCFSSPHLQARIQSSSPSPLPNLYSLSNSCSFYPEMAFQSVLPFILVTPSSFKVSLSLTWTITPHIPVSLLLLLFIFYPATKCDCMTLVFKPLCFLLVAWPMEEVQAP